MFRNYTLVCTPFDITELHSPLYFTRYFTINNERSKPINFAELNFPLNVGKNIVELHYIL